MLLIIIFLLGAFLLLLTFVFRVETRRLVSPWNCGENIQGTPVHQYTSGALSYSLRRLMKFLNPKGVQVPDYLPSRLTLSESPDNPQFVLEIFRTQYNRLINLLLGFSKRFGDRVQNKDIRRYVQYVFWVNLLILVVYWLTASVIATK